MFEEKPEAVADGKSEGDGESPHGADVPKLWTGFESGILAELTQGDYGNEDVDENVGQRVFLGRLAICF